MTAVTALLRAISRTGNLEFKIGSIGEEPVRYGILVPLEPRA